VVIPLVTVPLVALRAIGCGRAPAHASGSHAGSRIGAGAQR